MAQDAQLYNIATENLVAGKMPWSDTYKCALLTSGYLFDKDHVDFGDITNEISDASYTAGGQAITITDYTFNPATKTFNYEVDILIWNNLTAAEIRKCVIYNSTQDNQLVLYQDFGENIALTNETFVVVWPAGGIFNTKG